MREGENPILHVKTSHLPYDVIGKKIKKKKYQNEILYKLKVKEKVNALKAPVTKKKKSE